MKATSSPSRRDWLQQTFVDSGKLTAAALDDVLTGEGKYVHSGGDANWWIPAGRMFYSPGGDDTAAQELAHARTHFFLPHRYRDPFHTEQFNTETVVTFDDHRAHSCLRRATRSATRSRAQNDYRVLAPRLMTDPNGNRSEVAFDALGMVVGTAVMGKPLPAPVEGDSLDGFEADLTDAVILDHLAHPLVDPHAILQRATTRLVYDLFAYHRTKAQADPQPAVVVYPGPRDPRRRSGWRPDQDPAQLLLLRRLRPRDPEEDPGRAGAGAQRDADGKIIVGPDGQPEMTLNDFSPRWVGSGWTVFNNKGKPVRQYEPFFTDTHRFEFDVRIGVSPVLFYDPVERVVATLHPNHTWEKVVFDPWRQETWDVNDTVLVADPKTDSDVGDFFRRLPDAEYLPTWHALRTDPAHAAAFAAQYPDPQPARMRRRLRRKHRRTPPRPPSAHFDTLGRPFLTVAHNKVVCPSHDLDGTEDKFHTRVELDIEGNQREVRDAMRRTATAGRVVMRYDYDMLGNRIHQASMEAGERWMLNDVAGQPHPRLGQPGPPVPHRLRSAAAARRNLSPRRRPAPDRLDRAHGLWRDAGPTRRLLNLRGKVVQALRPGGRRHQRRLRLQGQPAAQPAAELLPQGTKYKTTAGLVAATSTLEAEIYTSRTRYDALNRPTELITRRTTASPAHLQRSQPAGAGRRQSARRGGRHALRHRHRLRRQRPAHADRLRQRRQDHLRIRPADLPPDPSDHHPASRAERPRDAALQGCGTVQDLHYTYDPAGNITHIADDALPTLFFANQQRGPGRPITPTTPSTA